MKNNQLNPHRICELLYAANFSLLFTHEIDSAYWQEWNLFGIPGGIQLFLLANLGMFVVAIIGYTLLLRQKRSGYWFSLVLAGLGVFAFAIHSYFILSGRPEFTLPASEALLGIILLVSVAQAVSAIKGLTKKSLTNA
jgi:hypothetical protein